MRPQSSPGFKGLPLVAKAGRRRHCVPRALVARERVMVAVSLPKSKNGRDHFGVLQATSRSGVIPRRSSGFLV